MNKFIRIIFDADRWSEAWTSLKRNPSRSLLTAFGVFWGIFMLVIMLSAGKGIKGGIFGSIEDVPNNMSICWASKTSIPFAGFRKGRFWEMNTDDLAEIKSKVEGIEVMAPIVMGGNANVVNGGKTGSYSIKGISGDYFSTIPSNIVAGRAINDLDVSQCRKVAVLGQKIVDEIFYGKAPVGQYVKIGGISYMVVGIAASTSESFNIGGSEDEAVTMPYTLVQRIYNMGNEVMMLMLKGKDDVPIASVEDQVGTILRSRHSISPDDEDAVGFMNVDKILQTFKALGLGIDLLIWIVGLGTLLSGAVGVSNIVMITVKERTNEIGVRRAIGAKPSEIVAQIMSESLIITSLSGIVGLMAGVAVMYFVGKLSTLGSGEQAIQLVDPMISFSTAVTALIILILTGLAAGLLPSSRALKIKAIDAIREE